MKSWVLREAEIRYQHGVRVGGAPRSVGGSADVDALVHEADDELCCASAVDERMIAFALDIKDRVFGWHLVGKGGATSCGVEPSALWRALVMVGAAGVVLVHNHPSGTPEPSADDVAITRRPQKSGELLGIRLLDHVMVTSERGVYFSLREAQPTRSRPTASQNLQPSTYLGPMVRRATRCSSRGDATVVNGLSLPGHCSTRRLHT